MKDHLLMRVLANKFWEQKLEELQAIEAGRIQAQDTIGVIFKKFIEQKKQYDKVADATIKDYNYRFNIIFKNYISSILSEQNVKNILENFIKNTNLTATTINNYLVAVQIFLNWASEEEQKYIPQKNYIKKYKQKATTSIRSPYTEEEYQKFINYFEENNKEMSLFIQFLWHTGARGSEAVNIKISDIDLKNNYIIVPNKKYKSQQETILLTDETKQIIRKILALNSSKSHKLFSFNSAKTPFYFLQNLEKQLGIKISGRGLHGFRRGFTDRLLDSGVAIQDTQHILRHRDISTTEKHYKSMYKKKLIKEMNEKLK